MEYEINSQIIKKAKECKSADDLLTLAKDNGIALTQAEAMNLFARLNPTSSELSDDELKVVSGGGCRDSTECVYNCPYCDAPPQETEYLGEASNDSPTNNREHGIRTYNSSRFRCTRCGRTFARLLIF